ncbi:hypothetical protein [Acidovorax sp. Leaf76]|uniref:hypothetical protein n=1 Tax=unclassified Acidovorax TaxID=2684926 RepID=UPI003FA4C391
MFRAGEDPEGPDQAALWAVFFLATFLPVFFLAVWAALVFATGAGAAAAGAATGAGAGAGAVAGACAKAPAANRPATRTARSFFIYAVSSVVERRVEGHAQKSHSSTRNDSSGGRVDRVFCDFFCH